MELLSIFLALLVGIGIGYSIKNPEKVNILPKSTGPKLKVFPKGEPKTFDERRQEALDKKKKMIKVFHK